MHIDKIKKKKVMLQIQPNAAPVFDKFLIVKFGWVYKPLKQNLIFQYMYYTTTLDQRSLNWSSTGT